MIKAGKDHLGGQCQTRRIQRINQRRAQAGAIDDPECLTTRHKGRLPFGKASLFFAGKEGAGARRGDLPVNC